MDGWVRFVINLSLPATGNLSKHTQNHLRQRRPNHLNCLRLTLSQAAQAVVLTKVSQHGYWPTIYRQ
jgi:hypothetical protein